jgi:hypothetical protein
MVNKVNVQNPDIRVFFKRYFTREDQFSFPKSSYNVNVENQKLFDEYKKRNTDYYKTVIVRDRVIEEANRIITSLYLQKEELEKVVSGNTKTVTTLDDDLKGLVSTMYSQLYSSPTDFKKFYKPKVGGRPDEQGVELTQVPLILVCYTRLCLSFKSLQTLFIRENETLTFSQLRNQIKEMGKIEKIAGGYKAMDGRVAFIPAFDTTMSYAIANPADWYEKVYRWQAGESGMYARVDPGGGLYIIEPLFDLLKMVDPSHFDEWFGDVQDSLIFYRSEFSSLAKETVTFIPKAFDGFKATLKGLGVRITQHIVGQLYTVSLNTATSYLNALQTYIQRFPSGRNVSDVTSDNRKLLTYITGEINKIKSAIGATHIVVGTASDTSENVIKVSTQYFNQSNFELPEVLASYMFSGSLYPTAQENFESQISEDPNKKNQIFFQYQGLGLTLSERKNFVFEFDRNSQSGFSYYRRGDLIFPHYEGGTLEVIKGITSVNTRISRLNSGTADIAIQVPIVDNNINDKVLNWFPPPTIYKDDKTGTKDIRPVQAFRNISGGEKQVQQSLLDILISKRECLFGPMDKIQVRIRKSPFYFQRWETIDPELYTCRKKYYESLDLEQAYVSAFTGLLTDASVDYGGGQITIKLSATDTTKWFKISRVNASPALMYNFEKSDPTIWTTQFANMKGAEIIEYLITGYWRNNQRVLGISDMVIASKAEYRGGFSRYVVGNSYRYETDFSLTMAMIDKTSIADWIPYVRVFGSIPLWQTEYKFRYEVAQDVTKVTEFEFYADGAGIIHYKPPQYICNPWLVKTTGYARDDVFDSTKHEVSPGKFYYAWQAPSDALEQGFVAMGLPNPDQTIEDIEIDTETVKNSDQPIVTLMTVTGSPEFGIREVALCNTDWVWNPKLLAKFGVKIYSKQMPLFSYENASQARKNLGIAILNRRNAEAKSLTITIAGRPEIELAKTVVLIDSYDDLANKLAIGSEAVAAIGFSNYIKDLFSSMLVYYVTEIQHNWRAGGRYTTTLILTHGRPWYPITPEMSVGFGLPQDEDFTKRIFNDQNILWETQRDLDREVAKGKVSKDTPSVPVPETVSRQCKELDEKKYNKLRNLWETGQIPRDRDTYYKWDKMVRTSAGAVQLNKEQWTVIRKLNVALGIKDTGNMTGLPFKLIGDIIYKYFLK